MPEISRRDTLFAAAACACCAFCTVDAKAADDPKAAPKLTSIKIGTLADYPKAGFYDKYARPNKVIVARLDDRLVAMSTACTHKGTSVRVKADAAEPTLKCPAHGAQFSIQGTPVAGPAKTALPRYAVSQAADGTITVDLTKSFIESKWEDAAAFIPLKPNAKAS